MIETRLISSFEGGQRENLKSVQFLVQKLYLGKSIGKVYSYVYVRHWKTD